MDAKPVRREETKESGKTQKEILRDQKAEKKKHHQYLVSKLK